MKTAMEIRSLRSTLGMDRVKFAEIVGVPVSKVEAWELGLETPSGWEESVLNGAVQSRAQAKARLAAEIARKQADWWKSGARAIYPRGGGGVLTDGRHVYVLPKK